ncbi:MAG: hypothetical protein ABI432_17345 [Flavobacteriales bacterium]
MSRRLIPCLLLTSLLLSVDSSAQSQLPGPKKAYVTTSGEWIFSLPILDVNDNSEGGVVRFSPVFNGQTMLNYDLSEHFGLYTGLSIRNQGFIYKVPDVDVRYKFRTYNVGVPVGFKVGSMNKTLVFLGYELELPFNYKEKRFEGDHKEDKFNVWFSDRNSMFYQSVFLGFQGPGSATITVRYYLTNFHNQDFTETKDGVTTKPYDGLNANIVAVSLGYGLFDVRKRMPMPHHSGSETLTKTAWDGR